MLDFLITVLPFLVAGIIFFFQEDKRGYLKKFGILLIIGAACSTIPLLHFGLLFGFYSYTLNAAVVAAIIEFKKE